MYLFHAFALHPELPGCRLDRNQVQPKVAEPHYANHLQTRWMTEWSRLVYVVNKTAYVYTIHTYRIDRYHMSTYTMLYMSICKNIHVCLQVLGPMILVDFLSMVFTSTHHKSISMHIHTININLKQGQGWVHAWSSWPWLHIQTTWTQIQAWSCWSPPWSPKSSSSLPALLHRCLSICYIYI